MKVSVHLRDGPNLTNFRSEALADGLLLLGHDIQVRGREEGIGDADLVVQTGFARSAAILDAIGKQKPYLIMEAPFWRSLPINEWVSWGYNGLAGGAFRHEPPEDPRPKPELQPLKTGGETLVVGQKPTDHSIRGVNHAEWIMEKLEQYPDAVFRPHPLTVPEGSLEPIEDVLSRCKRVITYTSTVGAEAVIAGCESIAEHPGSTAYRVDDREAWLHNLSWGHFATPEYASVGAKHIIAGYDEALSRMEAGLYEVPRLRINNNAVFAQYYSTLRGLRVQ